MNPKELPSPQRPHVQRGDCWCGYKALGLLDRKPDNTVGRGVFQR